MLTNLKLSKPQISKIIQSGGLVGSLLSKLTGSLLKVAVSLAKNILVPLGTTAAAPAIDAGIQKKIQFRSSFVLRSANINFNNFKQRND